MGAVGFIGILSLFLLGSSKAAEKAHQSEAHQTLDHVGAAPSLIAARSIRHL
jgi:hypothetical protein